MIWLLDTNIVIHALNGVPAVRDRLNAAADNDRMLTSTIVVALAQRGYRGPDRRQLGQLTTR